VVMAVLIGAPTRYIAGTRGPKETGEGYVRSERSSNHCIFIHRPTFTCAIVIMLIE